MNDARGTGASKVVEGPFNCDAQSVAERGEVGDVDKGPDEPGEKAGEVEFSDGADCFACADCGKAPFIEVFKSVMAVFRGVFF